MQMKIVAIAIITFFLLSCKQSSEEVIVPNDQLNLPTSPFDYSSLTMAPSLLEELKIRDNTPTDNQINNQTATLGRVLFYDKNLSINNTISCSSCHKQSLSFSDTTQFSTGFSGKLTAKHTMRLIDIRFFEQKSMFWDRRSPSLENQVTQPISHPVEMGIPLKDAITKISKLSYYPALFKNAFGDEKIDSIRISKALSQFVRSIVSTSSIYDLVQQGKAFYSTSEKRGDSLFFNIPIENGITCNNCHTAPAFLPVSNLFPRNSKSPKTAFLASEQLDDFKFGTLRNTGNLLRFFHDGRFRTLDDLFSSNIPFHSIPNKKDRQDLINFIKTLTDPSIATDVKYSNPFKNQ